MSNTKGRPRSMSRAARRAARACAPPPAIAMPAMSASPRNPLRRPLRHQAACRLGARSGAHASILRCAGSAPRQRSPARPAAPARPSRPVRHSRPHDRRFQQVKHSQQQHRQGADDPGLHAPLGRQRPQPGLQLRTGAQSVRDAVQRLGQIAAGPRRYARPRRSGRLPRMAPAVPAGPAPHLRGCLQAKLLRQRRLAVLGQMAQRRVERGAGAQRGTQHRQGHGQLPFEHAGAPADPSSVQGAQGPWDSPCRSDAGALPASALPATRRRTWPVRPRFRSWPLRHASARTTAPSTASDGGAPENQAGSHRPPISFPARAKAGNTPQATNPCRRSKRNSSCSWMRPLSMPARRRWTSPGAGHRPSAPIAGSGRRWRRYARARRPEADPARPSAPWLPGGPGASRGELRATWSANLRPVFIAVSMSNACRRGIRRRRSGPAACAAHCAPVRECRSCPCLPRWADAPPAPPGARVPGAALRHLDGDHALGVGNLVGQHAQQRGLAGPRAARNDQVAPGSHAERQEGRHGRAQRTATRQRIERQAAAGKLADRQARAPDRGGAG